MARSRRANTVLFGFDFQINAAIVLMLENISVLDYLRLEGVEDIELKLTDGTEILAQAKAIEKSSIDFSHVRTNLRKALMSLSEAAEKCVARELILITNSPNPFNDDNTRSLFWGPSQRTFDTLPGSARELIVKYLSEAAHPLDINKFKIQVLPFETDNDKERYKAVVHEVDDFINQLRVNIPGAGSELLRIWQDDIFHNGTKEEEKIALNKKDIIWPILVIATDIERCSSNLIQEFDFGLYNEISHKYKELIDSCCERYEFFIRVLADYNNYTCDKDTRERVRDFTLKQWENYIQEFPISSEDTEIQKGLIQLILYQIVTSRFTIDRIKKEVNL